MLQGPWKEGKTLTSAGCVEITVEDWDPEAFMILLNIIHGHMRKVPRSLDFEMLTKMAILVDYYECLEIMEFHAERWIDQLPAKRPFTNHDDPIRWLCISWVFRNGKLFKEITGDIQRSFSDRIPTLELPIPNSVLGKSIAFWGWCQDLVR